MPTHCEARCVNNEINKYILIFRGKNGKLNLIFGPNEEHSAVIYTAHECTNKCKKAVLLYFLILHYLLENYCNIMSTCPVRLIGLFSLWYSFRLIAFFKRLIVYGTFL